jgi:hypothetical protein
MESCATILNRSVVVGGGVVCESNHEQQLSRRRTHRITSIEINSHIMHQRFHYIDVSLCGCCVNGHHHAVCFVVNDQHWPTLSGLSVALNGSVAHLFAWTNMMGAVMTSQHKNICLNICLEYVQQSHINSHSLTLLKACLFEHSVRVLHCVKVTRLDGIISVNRFSLTLTVSIVECFN